MARKEIKSKAISNIAKSQLEKSNDGKRLPKSQQNLEEVYILHKKITLKWFRDETKRFAIKTCISCLSVIFNSS